MISNQINSITINTRTRKYNIRMMNRLFFFFVIFNFTNNLYSQSLSSNVLANSGDFFVNENSVSSTIGESLVFTNSQNNYSLYQGFQNTAIAVNEQLFYQNIDLPAGWSYWSTYLSPKDSEMSDLLSSIIDDLVILKDQHGDVFWPYFGINGIQNHTMDMVTKLKCSKIQH